jgi:hypothetical protein
MNTQTFIARITHPKTLAGRLRTACTTSLLPLLLLLALPAAVQAQFNYTINNGTITITGYAGPGGSVAIPDKIPDTPYGLPVTRPPSSVIFQPRLNKELETAVSMG